MFADSCKFHGRGARVHGCDDADGSLHGVNAAEIAEQFDTGATKNSLFGRVVEPDLKCNELCMSAAKSSSGPIGDCQAGEQWSVVDSCAASVVHHDGSEFVDVMSSQCKYVFSNPVVRGTFLSALKDRGLLYLECQKRS